MAFLSPGLAQSQQTHLHTFAQFTQNALPQIMSKIIYYS